MEENVETQLSSESVAPLANSATRDEDKTPLVTASS